MSPQQTSLFEQGPSLPAGFDYRADFLSEAEERELIDGIAGLSLSEFAFRGYLGKRRVASFGWHYDFNERSLRPAAEMPAFLLPLRDRAAKFAELAQEALPHVLVTEYGPGAGIGWHKDRPEFETVIGISLGAPCVFRLRRRRANGWERASLQALPRSAYLLRGAARREWEHSIPPVESLRYSVTFRSLRP